MVSCENKGLNIRENSKSFLEINFLLEKLQEEDWNEVYSPDNLDQSAEIFINKLKQYILDSTKIIKIKKKLEKTIMDNKGPSKLY